MRYVLPAVVLAACLALPAAAQQPRYFQLPKGDFARDVAVGPTGEVWYAGQAGGILGRFDPSTGKAERIPLGNGSAPHGVVVDPDGAPWVTDGGLNAIVRVDPNTRTIKAWPMPQGRGDIGLHTAAFDGKGRLWFTGNNGFYGRLDPRSGDVKIWNAPKGSGPYGITGTPSGEIWYVSLAASYLAKVDVETGAATVIEPPIKNSGTRRVWSDSKGRLWVSEWNTGGVSLYDPAAKSWKSWKLPGDGPRAYAVWVDPDDKVWLSEWTANAIVRFDPETEAFLSFPSDKPNADVRQILGRRGETWAAESGTDRLVVIK